MILILATVVTVENIYARHILSAAAQAADITARDEAHANPNQYQQDAKATAESWINQLGPDLLSVDFNDPRQWAISETPGTDGEENVTVTISSRIPTWIGTETITVTIQGPVEQFYPDTGQ